VIFVGPVLLLHSGVGVLTTAGQPP
jgi:hypothetical protein